MGGHMGEEACKIQIILKGCSTLLQKPQGVKMKISHRFLKHLFIFKNFCKLSRIKGQLKLRGCYALVLNVHIGKVKPPHRALIHWLIH